MLASITRTILLAAAACALLSATARSQVYINELTVRGNERVELVNTAADTVNVGGWKLQGGVGLYIIPSPTLIAPGAYIVLTVGNISVDTGGQTELIDTVGGTRDKVSYGQGGSAPLGEAAMMLTSNVPTLVRAPDARLLPPQAPSPFADAKVWTLDYSPTLGGQNDAPVPLLGSSIVMNELDPKPHGGDDGIELFNPTQNSIGVNGWYITNGNERMTLSGGLPPFGFLTIMTPSGFDLEENGLVYLFRADGVRVDQIGFWDGPLLTGVQCYGRCPDGAGPSDGFNWSTSGGGVFFDVRFCSPGAPNHTQPGCMAVDVDTPAQGFEPQLEAWPSILRSGTEVRLRGASASGGPWSVEVVDLRGRRLGTIPLREVAGLTFARWDGRAADGVPVPSGVYWLRVAEQPAWATRVIVVH